MKNVNIALGIPTYKRPKELAELLDTVPKEVSVYVSDNGNHLSDEFKARYPNVRFAGSNNTLPIFSNWNQALKMTEGDWVAIPSDDDVYIAGAFERVRLAIALNPTASMLVFGHNIIDGEGQTVSTWTPESAKAKAPSGFRFFCYGVDARMPSIFFRRSLLKNLDGFDEAYELTAGDSDFVQRASMLGDVVLVPDVISGYRVWPGGLTHQKIATQVWMREIDLWCEKMAAFAEGHKLKVYTKHLHDEIYARNLLSGIMITRKSGGFRQAWKHFIECRFPFKALWSTQARIIYRLIRP